VKDLAPRITVDQAVRFGKPVIKGTRVPVEVLVGKMAGGMTCDEVAEAYGVAREDVLAALAYAAETISREHILAA
jgi:uncharacterized protein (DUF433 family)